ncbi:unnamed protein product [Linum tenue]|uniref:Uncharacterized protein n=1 Tax=Linum tenue TaxID=586396 RepID=A0AAV0KF36_9ROSI|nr:unnamed protein product [Linum tenue]
MATTTLEEDAVIPAAPCYWLAELKHFDETKAGVKGLADAGITELPRIFHTPPHLLDNRASTASSPDDPNFVFPIDVELKKPFCHRDLSSKIVYNSNFDLSSC